MEQEQSELGSGIVVCLAKFSEHMQNRFMGRFIHARWWYNASEDRRQQWKSDAVRWPGGDSAKIVADVKSVFMGIRKSEEAELLCTLQMWANGASDHFYALNREKAPQELIDLAEYTLELGHGSGLMGKWEDTHDETYDKIYDLWMSACLAVDRQLGVEPDWGQW